MSISSIIVDGSVTDALLEYGTILDSIHRSNASSQEIESSQQDADKLVQVLNGSLTTIFKLNDRDFESVFNMYIYLVQSVALENGLDLSEVLKQADLSGLCKTSSINVDVLISSLTTIFNTVPIDCKIKLQILELIVAILVENDKISLISSLKFELIYQWLTPVVEDSELISFVISNFIDNLAEYPDQALQIYTELVAKLNDKLSTEQIDKFLQACINNESKLDLYNVSQFNLTKASPQLQDFITNYNAKNFDKLQAVDGVNKESLDLKLQIIKLIEICNGLNKIPYQELMSSLNISEVEELENLIIYSIKKKFINGKLNQHKHVLEINNVIMIGNFDSENWKLINNKLSSWKIHLKEIKESIEKKK